MSLLRAERAYIGYRGLKQGTNKYKCYGPLNILVALHLYYIRVIQRLVVKSRENH